MPKVTSILWSKNHEHIFWDLLQLNLLQCWQHCHTTLNHWFLKTYFCSGKCFTPDQHSVRILLLFKLFWIGPQDTIAGGISIKKIWTFPFKMKHHYGDIIMGTIASQITSLTIVLLNRLFRHRSRKTSKLCGTGLCAGNSPGTGTNGQ